MNPKVAQSIFVALNIFSIFAVAYVAYDFIDVSSAVKKKEDFIPFDTGAYYLLLMSVFWVFSVIQYAGINNKYSNILKHANQIVVFWFVLMLALANLIPYYLTNKLDEAGYKKCKDPAEISRVAKGESLVYIKSSECKY